MQCNAALVHCRFSMFCMHIGCILNFNHTRCNVLVIFIALVCLSSFHLF